MIITFYGTERSKNNAPQILAACAFETAFKMARKTLVLQFYSKYPIEDILIGKNQVSERVDVIENDETGVETLLRKSQTRGLNEEHFFTYTKPIFSGAGSKNAFDVAPVPKLADFKREIASRKEDVQNLLEVASNVYDNIFILADGKDEKVIKMLTELSDKQVVCVPQGNTQNVFCASANTIYVVTDFDTRSVYNVKRLKKQYDAKLLYAVPYNVNFKDAYLSNNVLKFLYENNSLEDQQNGFFITSIRKLTSAIVGEQIEGESGQTRFDLKNIPKIVSFEEKIDIKANDVSIETKKKHFWSKKKTVVTVKKDSESVVKEVEAAPVEEIEVIEVKEEPVKLKSTRKTTKKSMPEDVQSNENAQASKEVAKNETAKENKVAKKTVKKEVVKEVESPKTTAKSKKATAQEKTEVAGVKTETPAKKTTSAKKASTVKKATAEKETPIKRAAVAKTVKSAPTATKKVVKKADATKEVVEEAKAE